MVLGIGFFYESNAKVNMKAKVLMIMDEASPCMAPFVRGMSIGVALSSMW